MPYTRRLLLVLVAAASVLTASNIRSDEVRGASFLTTLGAVPFTTATVGVVNKSKLVCTGGNPGTCLLYDDTAMVGVTGFTLRAGDNQGANYLFSLTSAGGTALGGVNADNTIYRLGGITAAFPALKRNAAGIDFRVADDTVNTTANASAFLLGGNPLIVPGLGIGVAGGANISWTLTADTAYLATNASIQSATATTCVDAGATDDYACNILPALAGYPAGNNILQLWLTPNTTNTTDARLTVQALGLKKILKHDGRALATGDLQAGIPYLLVYDPGSDGGAGAFILSSLKGNAEIGTFGVTFDGGGAALPINTVGYTRVPFPNGCTITGWSIIADAGTGTFDIWAIAAGVALPTNANTITAAAEPALAIGNALRSTAIPGWTTAIAADDIIGINVDAAAAMTWAQVMIVCRKN